MTLENKQCSGCAQRHDCKSIYRTIGNAQGPSVVWKVMVAFLVPIGVFVLSVAAFGALLKGVIGSESLRTAAAFALAVVLALASVGLIRWLSSVRHRPGDVKQNRDNQHGNTRKENV